MGAKFYGPYPDRLDYLPRHGACPDEAMRSCEDILKAVEIARNSLLGMKRLKVFYVCFVCDHDRWIVQLYRLITDYAIYRGLEAYLVYSALSDDDNKTVWFGIKRLSVFKRVGYCILDKLDVFLERTIFGFMIGIKK